MLDIIWLLKKKSSRHRWLIRLMQLKAHQFPQPIALTSHLCRSGTHFAVGWTRGSLSVWDWAKLKPRASGIVVKYLNHSVTMPQPIWGYHIHAFLMVEYIIIYSALFLESNGCLWYLEQDFPFSLSKIISETTIISPKIFYIYSSSLPTAWRIRNIHLVFLRDRAFLFLSQTFIPG